MDSVEQWRSEPIQVFDQLIARIDGVMEGTRVNQKHTDLMLGLRNLKQTETVEKFDDDKSNR